MLIAAATLGGEQPPTVLLPEGTPADAAKLLQGFYSRYAAHDFDALADYYTDDAVYEDPTSDLFVRGKANIRSAMTAIAAYEDLRWQFHQIVRDGDRIAAQATLSGKLAGVSFRTRMATLLTLRAGRIAHRIDYLDNRPLVAASRGVAASDDAANASAVVTTRGDGAAKSRQQARRYVAALEQQQVAPLRALYSNAVIFEDPTFQTRLEGAEALGAYYASAMATYSFTRLTPHTLIADRDGAAIEGELFGISRGRQLTLRFLTLLRFEGDKISAQTDFYDYGEYERSVRAAAVLSEGELPSTACQSAEHERLLFWEGAWRARTGWGVPAGAIDVLRSAGGCVIVEYWRGRFPDDSQEHSGIGQHWYDAARNEWRHLWIDDRGSSAVEYTAESVDDGHIVYRSIAAAGGRGRRLSLSVLPDGRVEQLLEFSTDDGQSWQVLTQRFYERAD